MDGKQKRRRKASPNAQVALDFNLTPAPPEPPPSRRPADLPEIWLRARESWSTAVELKVPVQVRKNAREAGAIACIDLSTRQTFIDFTRLAELGLMDCLEALCAHEMGHHVRYPNTLVEGLRMTRFLRAELADVMTLSGRGDLLSGLAAGSWDFILNLLYDLSINTALVGRYEDSFVRLYNGLRPKAATPDAADALDPLFAFYMGLYEEGWYLEPGALLRPADEATLESLRPGWRTAARSCFQFIANAGHNPCLQLVRLLVELPPFLSAPGAEPASKASLEGRMAHGSSMSPEEVRRALSPCAGEGAARAWRRGGGVAGRPAAAKNGERAKGTTAASGQGTGGGTPGVGEGDPVRTLQDMLRGLCPPVDAALEAYRRLARKAAVDVPRSQLPGEADLPGPTEPWSLGDRVEDIDWMATLTRSGLPIPGLNLERRSFLPESPRPGDKLAPWIELYVDCSGSMPDPVQHFNYSILAGFILVDAALGAGGRVRVISYSSEARAMPAFVMSPRMAHLGLLTYVGGGTRFPFDVVQESHTRWRRSAAIHRVVISDADFFYNYRGNDVPGDGLTPAALVPWVFENTTRAPDSLVLLLQVPPEAPELNALRQTGARVVPVAAWADLPTVARELARALYPE